jgi:hypothetical protein
MTKHKGITRRTANDARNTGAVRLERVTDNFPARTEGLIGSLRGRFKGGDSLAEALGRERRRDDLIRSGKLRNWGGA